MNFLIAFGTDRRCGLRVNIRTMKAKNKILIVAGSNIGYDTAKFIGVKQDRNDNPFLNEK